jgi:hypothetical protein
MDIQFAIRTTSGKVRIIPAGSKATGTILGVIIDGSYHGELADDVRAAIAQDDVGSIWVGIRLRLGMTQKQLAEAAGCTQGAVAQWERRGNDPTHVIRKKILALL